MSTVSKVTCPECFTVLRPARPLAVGQKVKCPKCENLFTAEAEGPDDGKTVTAPAKKAAPAKAAPAKPEAKKKVVDDDDDGGGGTYGVIREKTNEEEAEDKPKISYAPDMSVKDLRGPAVAVLMQPSNYLLRAGIAGTLGWLTLIVMCAIPVLFPLSDDQRPIKPIGPGLAAGVPAGGVAAFGGGSGSGSGDKKNTEEERGSFLQLGPYDLTDIAQVGGRFMILLAFTPFFAGMVFSGILTFGAVKAQNLESRGWGIASCIMAMFPINVLGLGMATGVAIWLVLEFVFDAGWFRGFLLVMWMTTLWLMSLGCGVWCLITLLSEDVVAGFEYEPE